MKFKTVDIVGFRAYAKPGDGHFNFQNKNGEISNFISIYAPNGFGKSSFYDAMEWAITHNISRYIRDSLRSINQGTSKNLNSDIAGQRILRNRYISNNDSSYVDVKATNGFHFKKTVKKPKKGTRDYTYDPSDTNPETKNLIDIFLSQDAIDSFLKEERPELRYDKFMSAFGGADEKYRKKISIMLKLCQKELMNLNSEIKELNEKINTPELNFSIDIVNQTITEINDNLDSNQFSHIDNSFDDLKNIELKTKINKEILATNQKVINLQNSRNELLALNESIPNFLNFKKEIGRLESLLEKLKINKEKILEKEKLKSNTNNLEIDRKKIELDYQDINFLKIRFFEISDFISELKNIRILLKDARDNYEQNKLRVNNINKDLNNFSNLINIENSKRADFEFKLKNIDYQYSLIEQNENFLNINNKKIFDLKDRINKNQVSLNLLQVDLNKYLNLEISDKLIDTEIVLLLNPEREFINNFNNCLETRSNLNDELSDLKYKVDNLNSMSDKLYSLISTVSDIVHESKTDTCPICKTKHESFEKLINQIIDNSSSDLILNSLKKNIFEKENHLNSVNDFIEKGVVYLNGLKSNFITQFEQKKQKISSDILGFNSQIKLLINESENYSSQLNNLKGGMLNLSKEDSIINLNKKISDILLIIKSYENKILSLNSSLINLQKDNDKELAKINNFELQISKIINNDLYNYYLKIKEKYLIPDDFNIKYIEEKLQNLENELNLKKSIYDSCTEKLILVDSFLNDNSNHNSISLLDKDVQQVLQSIKVFSTKCNETISILGKYIDMNAFNIENIPLDLEKALRNIDINISKNQSNILTLQTLEFQISQVLPFIMYWETQREIDEKKLRIVNLELLILKMKSDLNTVKQRLLDKIDVFFYTQLINKIYKKIDPHPTFKDVKFDCVFNEDEKPRLEVYLYEKDSLTPISPSLYFSSAQLNILSLSIFLARALHVEHKGKPVNAILIDDPIQSMDSINVLATIDLLRNISKKFDKQIILSTHDENFHELLKLKIPEHEFGSKFISFSSYGKVIQS